MEPFQPDDEMSRSASGRFGWPFWLSLAVMGLVVYEVFAPESFGCLSQTPAHVEPIKSPHDDSAT
jgi:hypothetical protein